MSTDYRARMGEITVNTRQKFGKARRVVLYNYASGQQTNNKQTNTLVAILRSVLWEWMVKHRGCLIPNSNTGDVAHTTPDVH